MNTPMKIAVAVVIIALMGLGFYVVDWSEKKKKIVATTLMTHTESR